MNKAKLTWRQILEFIIALLTLLQGYVPERPSKAIQRKTIAAVERKSTTQRS